MLAQLVEDLRLDEGWRASVYSRIARVGSGVTLADSLTTVNLSRRSTMADSHPTEKWRPVVGFDGLYVVSDHGRLRSLPRSYVRYGRSGCKQTVHVGGNILLGHVRKYRTGRPVVVLVSLIDETGKHYTKRVHRIVLEAFRGQCPEGMEGCHNDGDPENNRLNNLRWDTRSSNLADMVTHGTTTIPPVHIGESHPRSKLTEYGQRLGQEELSSSSRVNMGSAQ